MYNSYEGKEKDIMAHENARAGYSKLFTAQVLSLIAALCTLLMLIPVHGISSMNSTFRTAISEKSTLGNFKAYDIFIPPLPGKI